MWRRTDVDAFHGPWVVVEDGEIVHGFLSECEARRFTDEMRWRGLLALSAEAAPDVLGTPIDEERAWAHKQPNTLQWITPG